MTVTPQNMSESHSIRILRLFRKENSIKFILNRSTLECLLEIKMCQKDISVQFGLECISSNCIFQTNKISALTKSRYSAGFRHVLWDYRDLAFVQSHNTLWNCDVFAWSPSGPLCEWVMPRTHMNKRWQCIHIYVYIYIYIYIRVSAQLLLECLLCILCIVNYVWVWVCVFVYIYI